jgi:histidinol dehydrogenase
MRVLKADDPGFDKALEVFKSRISFDDANLEAGVREIIHMVRQKGDQALLEYIERFDRVSLTKDGLKERD